MADQALLSAPLTARPFICVWIDDKEKIMASAAT
jgi:hypothetical protein